MMPTCQATKHQRVIEPAILYFGTPVVLIGSGNDDGTPNLAPMSSAWWLGWRCMLGLARLSKTTENILRTGECVLNLPSDGMADAVNRLARTTGSNPVPAGKIMRGYRYEKDKFAAAKLTATAGDLERIPVQTNRRRALDSLFDRIFYGEPVPTSPENALVAAPRAIECPVQMEARVDTVHDIAAIDRLWGGRSVAIEVKIVRVHADESILIPNAPNRIDPDKWRPLIMSFQQFYRLADGKLQHSALGEIPDEAYRPVEARMG